MKKEREREKKEKNDANECWSSLETRVWLEKVILVISCNKLLSVYWCEEYKQYLSVKWKLLSMYWPEREMSLQMSTGPTSFLGCPGSKQT